MRYPEELFNVQTRVLGRYHVTNPLRFFQNDDLWTVPTGQANEQSLPSEAYYVIMRMPGESKAEFLLLQPMIPISRPNMIAWVAARNDGETYGTTRVYRFPAETTIFGPAQIEARIDQDPIISEQFTLWRNSGSDVIRGNLIVVPVGDSLLYLQPIYLQSTGSAFPEFRRIVVASPRQVVWGDDPGRGAPAAAGARGRGRPEPDARPRRPIPARSPGPSPSGEPEPSPSTDPGEPLPADVAGLIDYANRHFELAQAALRDGDFAPLRRGDRAGRGGAASDSTQLAPGPVRAVARRGIAQPRAVIRGATLGASLLAVLAEPGHLGRSRSSRSCFAAAGCVVLAPIVAIPSAVGLGNLLGPVLTDLALGDLATGAADRRVGSGLLVVAIWLGWPAWWPRPRRPSRSGSSRRMPRPTTRTVRLVVTPQRIAVGRGAGPRSPGSWPCCRWSSRSPSAGSASSPSPIAS